MSAISSALRPAATLPAAPPRPPSYENKIHEVFTSCQSEFSKFRDLLEKFKETPGTGPYKQTFKEYEDNIHTLFTQYRQLKGNRKLRRLKDHRKPSVKVDRDDYKKISKDLEKVIYKFFLHYQSGLSRCKNDFRNFAERVNTEPNEPIGNLQTSLTLITESDDVISNLQPSSTLITESDDAISNLQPSSTLINDQNPSNASSLINGFFNYGSIVVFLAACVIVGAEIAGAIATSITVLQIIWLLARHEPVPGILWLDLALFILCGGMSFFLDNPFFMELKGSVLQLVIAAVIFASEWSDKTWLESSIERLSGPVNLPRELLFELNRGWGAFFASSGVAGIVVACTCSIETLIIFSFIGFPASLLFGLYQRKWLEKQLADNYEIIRVTA